MKSPAYVPLTADRFTAYGATLNMAFSTVGKTFRGQIRTARNAPGTPLVTIPLVVNPSLTGLRILVQDAVSTRLGLVILKNDIAAMTSSTKSDDQFFAYDILATSSNGTEEVIMYGPFVLRAGVTQ